MGLEWYWGYSVMWLNTASRGLGTLQEEMAVSMGVWCDTFTAEHTALASSTGIWICRWLDPVSRISRWKLLE